MRTREQSSTSGGAELAATARSVASDRGADSNGALGGLDRFRVRLDEIDDALAFLLGERFQICREVAGYKSEHEIAMMQPGRVEQVRARYMERGAEAGVPPEFSGDLFELVIAATCKMEDELMGAAAEEAGTTTPTPGGVVAAGAREAGVGDGQGAER
jgi:4-amino-4-deoxychorismate mutase